MLRASCAARSRTANRSVIYAQTDPIPIDDALAEDRARVAGRRRPGHRRRAAASSPRRARRLLAAPDARPSSAPPAQSSPPSPHGGGSPSPTARRPDDRPRAVPARGNARPRARPLWQTHHAPRSESLRLTGQVAGRARRRRDRDLPASTACRRSRCCGSAFTPPPSSPTSTAARRGASASPQRPAPSRPREQRHRMLEAMLRGAGSGRSTPARTPGGCATPTGRSRRSCISGPRRCRPARGGWRTCSSCPLPATVAVHITVGHRGREQAPPAPAVEAARAAVLYKQRRAQLVGSDEEDALDEAAGRRRRARRRDRRDRLQGRDLLRDPRPARRAPTSSSALVRQTAREFHALTNARVVRGRRLCAARIHRDAAARRRPAAREAQLRAAEHRALRSADLEPLRVAGRADPRVRRSRRDGRADRPVRPALPATTSRSIARPVRRRQDGLDQRAA